MEIPQLHPNCVFTIRNLDDLKATYKNGGVGQVIENKRWVTAKKRLREAQKEGQALIVFFSDAAGCGELHYWAILTAIDVADKTTTVHFGNLCEFSKNAKPPQESLTVASTEEALSASHIKPYVICVSPLSKSRLAKCMRQSRSPRLK